jgi:leader peptidase (prepilin peptidase) / N-methyltransferase
MLNLTIAAFLGWLAGLMVNYLADVLPIRRKLVAPFCLACGEKAGLFNYLILPRRCDACGHLRSRRTWMVEVIFILISIGLMIHPSMRLSFLVSLVLFVYFGVVIVIDIEHRLILHLVSLVGAVFSFGIGIALHGWVFTLLGGVAGIGIMWLLYYLGVLFLKLVKREQAKEEEALGFGDVILSGVLGLLLGWPGVIAGIILTIFLAGGAGLVYLLVKLVRRQYSSNLSIPYGPFLVAGAIILLFLKDFLP